ncbi:TOMM precursor leader peptide-binding protein [Streptomyces massasporeus]|uniref:TOMM precursor leader peptide-binding protein n=1 Tax=Streptomyces massasporeus TaxID=67324 RepID=UPI003693A419
MDDFAFEWSQTWTPLLLTPRGVRLGPVVVPGRSACYHCFLSRWLQHDKEIGDTRARLRNVADDASRTVTGWLPSDVSIASGLTEALAHAVDTGATTGAGVLGGTVTTYDAISGTLSRDAVIGVHACWRCRKRADRNTDTWAGLARQFPPTHPGGNHSSRSEKAS